MKPSGSLRLYFESFVRDLFLPLVGDVFDGEFHEAVYDSLEVAGLVEDAALLVGGGTALQDGVNMLDLLARLHLVEHGVYEVEQFTDEVARRHLFLFAEVEQLAVEPVTHGAPLVLLYEHAAVETEPQILLNQLVEARDDGLEERGDGDRVVHARRGVADADVKGREERVRAPVPPNLLRAADAVGVEQKLDVTLVQGVRAEVVGDVRARELLEDFGAVRLEPRVDAEPEGGRGREREDVRQEVARRVHDVYLPLAVGDADVDVHAEDEQRARDHLQLLDEELVMRVVVNQLLVPLRDGVSRSGGDVRFFLAPEPGGDGAQACDVVARLLYVAADAGADLDLCLNHLGLDLLAEHHLALIEHLRDARAQLPRLRVYDLKLLLDSQRVAFRHHCEVLLARKGARPYPFLSAASRCARSSSESP